MGLVFGAADCRPFDVSFEAFAYISWVLNGGWG